MKKNASAEQTAGVMGSDAGELRRTMTAMFDALPQLAWIARADGQTEVWNRRIREYTGLDADALGGGNLWRIVVHPDDLAIASLPWFGREPADGTVEAEFRLRRHDGAYRWFGIRLTAVTDERGRVTRWFGSASDIEDRKRQEIAMHVLADAGGLLSVTSDLGTRLQRIAQRITDDVADACEIFLTDAAGELVVQAIARPAGGAQRALDTARRYPVRGNDPRRAVSRSGRAQLHERVTREVLQSIAHDPAHFEFLETLDIGSMLIVPLTTAGRVLGVIRLENLTANRAFDQRDLQLVEALAERMAVAIDNEHVHARDRRASLIFQHAALPRTLPAIEGVELQAVYASSELGAEVGGDWYDAFELPHGMLALSIGDVAGRGVDAAVLMSIVRQAIRVAMLQGLDPARALRAADLALESEGAQRLVTAFVARIDPREGPFTYALAGHPPPFVRSIDGAVRALSAIPAPPLGIGARTKAPTGHARLDRGDLLVLYTDGLIEAGRDPIAGERTLIEVLGDEALAHNANPATFIRDATLRDGITDDVALLTLRVATGRRWSFACDDAMAAQGARSAFVAHLAALSAEGSDYAAAELLFGELVGNVVRYAPGALDVGLDWRRERPVLHLIDRGPGYDLNPRPPADMLAESGRGLFLCSALGQDFRVRKHVAGGAHSSVELPVRAAPAEPA